MRWDPELRRMVEVPLNAPQRSRGPLVVPDIPDYVSPVTGKLVSGRRQRREDLKRTGSRPWEGMESERKEVARFHAEQDRKNDARLEHAVRTEFHQLPPEKRRLLEGR
jgi:hypothetical protein